MELWEFLKGLANMEPLDILVMIFNPVYGPMFLWIVLGCLVSDLQKLFGIRWIRMMQTIRIVCVPWWLLISEDHQQRRIGGLILAQRLIQSGVLSERGWKWFWNPCTTEQGIPKTVQSVTEAAVNIVKDIFLTTIFQIRFSSLPDTAWVRRLPILWRST